MTPVISTIIPMHNSEAYILDAINSVRTQSFTDWELIVVDDGSTDGGPALVEDIALDDERVWIINQSNEGVSAARNAGINVARGKYLHFLDSDDWLLPGAFDRLLIAASSARFGAACGGAALHDEHGTPLKWSFDAGIAEFGLAELLEHNRFQPGASLLRRDILADHRFDASYGCAEDWDLWIRLAEHGVRWGVVPHDVSAYRVRADGLSHGWGRMSVACRRVLENAFGRARLHVSPTVLPRERLRGSELDRLLKRSALQNASAMALHDSTAQADEAWAVLRAGWPGSTIEPEAAAEAALWMVAYADLKPPSAWTSGHPGLLARYAAPLDRFWRRCTEELNLGPVFIEKTRSELARLMVPPERTVAALIAPCLTTGFGGREVVLLGLGRNARHVAAALRSHGIHFDARDDAVSTRSGASASFAEVAGVEIEVLGNDAPYNPSAFHIVTPTADEALVSRLPQALEIVRWSDVHRALARESLDRLIQAWPKSGSIASLGAAA